MFILNKNEFTQKVLDAESTLYHVAKSILRSEADCEDAVQEAIAIAWQKLPTLKTDAYFTTWLVRILINECKSVLRRPKAVGDIDLLEAEAALQTENSEVYEALMRLKPKLRTVTVLYYVEGYCVKEVSELLTLPQGTVKSRLAAARQALKDILTESE